jgi:multidrug efflux pump subunit AcrB
LTSFAIEHPTSVVVMAVLIALMGLRSYITVPKESFPEIVFPTIVISTLYPGVAPEDIETLITRPIEEELNGITDIETIQSISVEGYSSITAEFDVGVDITEALQKVREKVDLALPEIPAAAEDPTITEINFAEFPIIQVNVAADYGLVRLREVAEDLQDRLELVPSILEARLAGGLEREVQVDVDLPKLKFYGLAFEDVIDAIAAENVTVPGGTIDVGNLKYLVRVPGEFDDPQPIADIVVEMRNGRPIYIKDVATVDFGFKDRDSFARLNGENVVTLSIIKRSGENIIATVGAVQAIIDEMEPGFPPGTSVATTSDQSKEIRNMVSSLENNIISGLILVVAVLLFFLGVRTASFVGAAIPMSMLLSFTIISLVGISMNMVVLFSLILALGMLVDNAVVVVENIYRYREMGHDQKDAAKLATGEVAWPIIASTATTLAAFLPMAFWPGIVGEFMRYLPLTLIITLSSSLFVGLVIVPTACAYLLEPEGVQRPAMPKAARRVIVGAIGMVVVFGMLINWMATLLLVLTAVAIWAVHHFGMRHVQRWFMTKGLDAILLRYQRFLDWALNHRWRIVGASASALVVAILAFGALNAGVEFFPEDIPPANVYVQVESPVGTRIERTDAIVSQIEQRLGELEGAVDYESLVSTVGSQVTADGFGRNTGSHLGTVVVNFVDYQERQHDVFETLETMRSTLGSNVAGATISVEKPANDPSGGAPINLEIVGEDPEILRQLGDRAVSALENSPVFAKLDGLENSLSSGQPELVVQVDREKAGLYGLNTRDVGQTLRSAINGTEASKYRDGKDEYDITVRLAKAYREDLSSLADLTVLADGQQVPLSSVADWYTGEGYSDVQRKDLNRVATVSSDVRAGFNANAVLAEVQGILEDFDQGLPPGYHTQFTGQQEDQAESQAFLLGAFMMALFLIAFILVSQFDSVFKPFIILSSVILSTVGVLIGLIVFRMPFGIIMTGVGVISLAGVVVNNAIVLIDYVGILRERDGLDVREALMQAGLTRFRPVILTAITTVLGLVPLAVGLNFDFVGLYTALSPEFYWGGEQAAWWGPMAIAVIAGLTFATFLTLVLVPVLYSLFDDFELALVRNFTNKGVEEHAKQQKAQDRPRGGETEGPVSGEPVPV